MTKGLEIDLRDPAVQRMMGGGSGLVTPTGDRPRKLMQLAGDEAHGLASTVNLAAGRHEVVCLAKDAVLTLDVYMLPSEPVKVHLICPRCHHHLTITGDKKHIEFEPGVENPVGRTVMPDLEPALQATARMGRISIEAFECTWEIDGSRAVSRASGLNLCRWRAAIDNNVIKNA